MNCGGMALLDAPLGSRENAYCATTSGPRPSALPAVRAVRENGDTVANTSGLGLKAVGVSVLAVVLVGWCTAAVIVRLASRRDRAPR
jgi:hypothetical protein